MDIITFTAPAYFASYFINGDDSGLSDSDKLEAESIVSDLVEAYGSCHIHDAEDIGFTHRMDYGRLAGDACRYAFTI